MLRIRRLYLATAYLFLNYNWILVYEIYLSDRWGRSQLARVLNKNLTLCSIYRSNQPLWKIHGIV